MFFDFGSLLTATNQKRLFGLFPSFRFTFYQNFHFGVHEFSWLRSPFSKRRAEHSRPFFPGPLHWPSQQALIGRSEKTNDLSCLVTACSGFDIGTLVSLPCWNGCHGLRRFPQTPHIRPNRCALRLINRVKRVRLIAFCLPEAIDHREDAALLLCVSCESLPKVLSAVKPRSFRFRAKSSFEPFAIFIFNGARLSKHGPDREKDATPPEP